MEVTVQTGRVIPRKLSLAIKSSLISTTMLMPAAAWTRLPAAMDERPAINWSDDSASETLKIDALSSHVQRKYRVREGKARQIVREAFVSAKAHQLEPELILAVIAVESTFKEKAVSRVGAKGLMQVMPGVHKKKLQDIGGHHALFDPAKNIHTGSRILVEYLENHSGDVRRALLNYNGSLGTRSKFPDRVLRAYQDFQNNAG